MIARLVLFILVDVILLTGVFYGGRAALHAHPRTRLWLERRKRQSLGRLNASKIDHRSFEFCAACLGHIDPKVDLFQERRWIHKKCLKKIHAEIEGTTHPQLTDRKD